MDKTRQIALNEIVKDVFGNDARIIKIKRLGGIGNENYKVDVLTKRGTITLSLKIFLGSLHEARRKATKEEYFIRRLSEVGLNVPNILYYDPEGRRLGRPILIKRWISGIPVNKALEKDYDNKDVIVDVYARELATLHRVVPKPSDFMVIKEIRTPAEYIVRQFKIIEILSKIVKFDMSKVINALRKDMPCSGDITFLHGDYAPENVLVNTSYDTIYFIDLESIELGVNEDDVAYAFHMLRFIESINKRLKGVAEDFIESYEKHYGKTLKNLEYFKVLSAAKLYVVLKYLMKTGRLIRERKTWLLIYPFLYMFFFRRVMKYLKEYITNINFTM